MRACMHACSDSGVAAAQMTTGAPCISIIGGLTPIFRGTITVHNKAFQQSVTLEFRRDSAWKSLAFKEVVKDGVGCTSWILYMSSAPYLLGRQQWVCMLWSLPLPALCTE